MKTPKELKGLYFPVEKQNIEEELEASGIDWGLEFDSWLSHWVVVRGSKVVNACSKDYTIVTNEEIYEPIWQALSAKYDVRVKIRNRNDSKFYVSFILNDHSFTGVLKKDQILPMVKVYNSYDGSLKYQYSFGFHRVVCSNGMTLPVGKIQLNKFMHTPGIDVKRITKDLDKFLEEAKDLVIGYRDLGKKKLTQAEALTKLEEIQTDADYPRTIIPQVVERLQVEINEGFPISDYLLYNSMNYALYNSESAMPEHKMDKVDSKVMQFLLNQ